MTEYHCVAISCLLPESQLPIRRPLRDLLTQWGVLPRAVEFLPVDGDVGFGFAAVAAGVSADELHRLHEHARGAAAEVVDAAAVEIEHLHQQLHHATRGVELAAFLALGAGKLRQ